MTDFSETWPTFGLELDRRVDYKIEKSEYLYRPRRQPSRDLDIRDILLFVRNICRNGSVMACDA